MRSQVNPSEGDPRWLSIISPQLRIFWHGRNPAKWVEPARRLYDHELVVVTEGTCRITVAGRPYCCEANTFLVVPPDILHETQCVSGHGMHRYCLHFDWIHSDVKLPPGFCVFHPARIPRHLLRLAPSFIPPAVLHGTVRDASETTQLLTRIRDLWQKQDPVRHLLCRGLLLQLLLELLAPAGLPPEAAGETADLRLAQRVRHLLQVPFPQTKSIQAEIETLGYSYAHVCRIFKRVYGVRPLFYANVMRVEKAKVVLKEGGAVEKAARQAGFNDPGYFTRVFHKLTGMTPRVFAARVARHQA